MRYHFSLQKVLLAFTFVLCLGYQSNAATPIDTPEVQKKIQLSLKQQTPYDTLVLFLSAMDLYKSEKDKKDLTAATRHLHTASKAFSTNHTSSEEVTALALRLTKILGTKGVKIKLDKVPNDPNFQNEEKKERYYIASQVPGLFLQKEGGKWVFGENAIDYLDHLYRKIYHFKLLYCLQLDELENIFPYTWQNTVFGLEIWKYITLLILLGLTALLHLIITRIFRVVYQAFLKRKGHVLALQRYMKYVRSISNPFSIAVICIPWDFFAIPGLQLPVSINHFLVHIINITFILSCTLVSYRFVKIVSFYIERSVAERRMKFNVALLPLIRSFSHVIIIISGVLFIFRHLGFSITAILASFSLGSLGLGLASQDTLSNLFGSLMLFTDEPFSVGDYIVNKDAEGTVLEIGLRSTKLETPSGSIIHIPNSKVATSPIDNHGRNLHKRYSNVILLPSATSLTTLEKFIKGFHEILHKHPQTLHTHCHVMLTDLKGTAFEVSFTLAFKTSNRQKTLVYRQEILLKVVEFTKKLGIKLEF